MTNEEIIEEILHEAGKHGLLFEVLDEAKKIMDNDKSIDRAQAYQIAFDEWVK